jgi:hypothetical protein
MEPHRLRRWRRRSSPEPTPIYTCSRPGRSFGASGHVTDSIVSRWLAGLPNHRHLAIASLLGKKPDGTDEHSFYSFLSAEGFQDWVALHSGFSVSIYHHPTVDFEEVPSTLIEAVGVTLVRELLLGHSVLILDSGGEQRSGYVCKMLGLCEDPRTLITPP